jgi:superfamily II DNA/RNA helicase
MNEFNKFKLSKELKDAINNAKITEPTQIQRDSIPAILEGKDVLGESATGSGKTLAFGCGIIEKSIHGKGIQALVLAPTRELAEQVKKALVTFSKSQKLNILSVFGGVAIGPQIDKLQTADVVVATPGRLLDHMERGTIDLSKVNMLVLDEADRMLDMGFIDDVERIVKKCPEERQTLFFSATMPAQVQKLSQKYMVSPVKVSAERMVDPTKLTQCYYDVQKKMKLSLLVHLLENERAGLVIVFCNTRMTTTFVAKTLKMNKISALEIHGGQTQNKREKALQMFSGAKVGVLVCTDVAARGLHIDNVSHVYNYDVPRDPNDYVHRIGRTARAGEDGAVINLLCDRDYENFGRLTHEHRDYKIMKKPVPEVKRVQAAKIEHVASKPRRGSGRGQGRPAPKRRMSYGV